MEQQTPLDDLIGDLRHYIHTDVAAGFYDAADIVERAVDMLSDEMEPERLRAPAEQLARAALSAHLRAQAAWPPVTDCDRLDSAFDELEERGIVARQNFSCCGNCGASEIWAEVEDAEGDGRAVRGYAFYHEQDTEAAVEGQGICLNYGAAEEGEAAALEVARDIVRTLERHGLEVEWDGSWQKRIAVALDWKRRRQPF
jgi:hypothetical protein